jgi:hypothetical protein
MNGMPAAGAVAAAMSEGHMPDHSKRAFEDTVKTVLTTFGVFTGFAIKSAIDGIQFPDSASWWASLEPPKDFHLYVCLATVALLLRFIIGSAVHLNLCYVVEPRSKKPVMLFKDIAFLIVFGLLAIFMIKANDQALFPHNVEAFAKRAFLFIAVGFLWSVVDWLVRLRQTNAGEKTLFSLPWMGIDLAQLALILIVLYALQDPWWQSVWLAAGFAVALYLDMKIVLAPEKPAPPANAREEAVAAAMTTAAAAAIAAAPVPAVAAG